MNSYQLKGALLNYFYQRNMISATECTIYLSRADILASNGKKIYEVEIKTNVSDFMQDFKKVKHHYMKKNNIIIKYHPNYFYFGIEDNLYEKIENQIPDYAGVIIIENFDKCYIIKRAKLLHKEFNFKDHEEIIKRNSYEIVKFYKEKYKK